MNTNEAQALNQQPEAQQQNNQQFENVQPTAGPTVAETVEKETSGVAQSVESAAEEAKQVQEQLDQLGGTGDQQGSIDPELVNQWAQLRMGHEAMMLEKIQRQNRLVEDNVKSLQRQAGGEVSSAEDEEMGVSIGNKNYYIQPSQQPPQPQPQPQPQPVAPQVQVVPAPEGAKTSSPWLPLALLASGALTGGGAFLGLSSMDFSQTSQPPPADTFTDVAGAFGVPVDVIKDSIKDSDQWEVISPESLRP